MAKDKGKTTSTTAAKAQDIARKGVTAEKAASVRGGGASRTQVGGQAGGSPQFQPLPPEKRRDLAKGM